MNTCLFVVHEEEKINKTFHDCFAFASSMEGTTAMSEKFSIVLDKIVYDTIPSALTMLFLSVFRFFFLSFLFIFVVWLWKSIVRLKLWKLQHPRTERNRTCP